MSPLFARAAIILLFLTTPYVRKQGLGSSQTEHLPRKPAWLILCLLVAIAIYILQMPSAWLLLSLIAVFLLLRALMMHRLGGTTGDTAGAMVEIIEIQVLLALVV